jgi:hypothetical protein
VSIREEDYLYAIVFDNSILSKANLVSNLKTWGCWKIAHGPTEHSIEFRLNTSKWTKDRWTEWFLFIDSALEKYKFNKNRSCLPIE